MHHLHHEELLRVRHAEQLAEAERWRQANRIRIARALARRAERAARRAARAAERAHRAAERAGVAPPEFTDPQAWAADRPSGLPPAGVSVPRPRKAGESLTRM